MMRAEFRSGDAATPIPGEADIFYALSVDGIHFRGRVGITYELSSVYEASRYFERDAVNVRASTGMRYTW